MRSILQHLFIRFFHFPYFIFKKPLLCTVSFKRLRSCTVPILALGLVFSFQLPSHAFLNEGTKTLNMGPIQEKDITLGAPMTNSAIKDLLSSNVLKVLKKGAKSSRPSSETIASTASAHIQFNEFNEYAVTSAQVDQNNLPFVNDNFYVKGETDNDLSTLLADKDLVFIAGFTDNTGNITSVVASTELFAVENDPRSFWLKVLPCVNTSAQNILFAIYNSNDPAGTISNIGTVTNFQCVDVPAPLITSSPAQLDLADMPIDPDGNYSFSMGTNINPDNMFQETVLGVALVVPDAEEQFFIYPNVEFFPGTVVVKFPPLYGQAFNVQFILYNELLSQVSNIETVTINPLEASDPISEGIVPPDPNGPAEDAFNGVPYANPATIIVEPGRWKVVGGNWINTPDALPQAIQNADPGDIIEASGNFPSFKVGSYENSSNNARTCGGLPEDPIIVRAKKNTNYIYEEFSVGSNDPTAGMGGDTILFSRKWCIDNPGNGPADGGYIHFYGMTVNGRERSAIIMDSNGMDADAWNSFGTAYHKGYTFVGLKIDGHYDHDCGIPTTVPTASQFQSICNNGVGCGFNSKWGMITHWASYSLYGNENTVCEISGIKQEHGIYAHNTPDGIRVVGCKIHDTGRTGIQMVARANEGPWSDAPSYFVNNHFYNNNRNDGGAQMSFSQAGNIHLYNNTFEAIAERSLASGKEYNTLGGPTYAVTVWPESTEEKWPLPFWWSHDYNDAPDYPLIGAGNYNPVLPGPQAYGVQNSYRIEMKGNTFLYDPDLKNSPWWNDQCTTQMKLGTSDMVKLGDLREVVIEDNVMIAADRRALAIDDDGAYIWHLNGCGNEMSSENYSNPQACDSYTSAANCPDLTVQCE